MLICWQKTEECNISLDEIFVENQFETIKYSDIFQSKYIYFGNIHVESLFDNIESNLNSDNDLSYIVIKGGHEFKNPRLSVQQFVKRKHEFYKSLIQHI